MFGAISGTGLVMHLNPRHEFGFGGIKHHSVDAIEHRRDSRRFINGNHAHENRSTCFFANPCYGIRRQARINRHHFRIDDGLLSLR